MFKPKLEAFLFAFAFALTAWFLTQSAIFEKYAVIVPASRELTIGLSALAGYLLANALRVSRVVDEGSTSEGRAALAREPGPDEALVFFRRGGGVAANGTMDLSVDGTTVSHLQGNQFTCFAVKPGQRLITGHFLGRGAREIPDQSFDAVLAPGEKTLISLEIGFGWVRPTITWTREPFAAARLARAAFVRSR